MYKNLILLFLTMFLLAPLAAAQAAPARQPALVPEFTDGYQLIDAVNQLRAANGLPPYQVNTALMISAHPFGLQAFSLGTWSHDGICTDEAQRQRSRVRRRHLLPR
jgi:hypothetical protein